MNFCPKYVIEQSTETEATKRENPFALVWKQINNEKS